MSFPQSSEVVRKYLARALQDDRERPKPPITLAGPQTNGSTPPPSWTAPIPKVTTSGTPYTERLKVREEAEPGDEQWPYTRAELIRMNDRFIERMEQALARGLEKLPREVEARVWERRVRIAQMHSKACAHCGRRFVPIRRTRKFCSQYCRGAHQRQAAA
jgi:hypothetical protein